MKRIATETPEREQWRSLLRFAFPANVRRHIDRRLGKSIGDDVIDTVNGAILQGNAYFDATTTASLHIAPLLMYYGAINLLHAACILQTAEIPKIDEHGMSLIVGSTSRLADGIVRVRNAKTGGLSVYGAIVSASPFACPPVGSDWSIGELFGTVPDLFQEFVDTYEGLNPQVLPVEIVKRRKGSLERITKTALSAVGKPGDVFGRIEGFERTYITPQEAQSYFVLRKKLMSQDIGISSIAGRKYLQLAHQHQGKSVTAAPIVVMLMALYALGMVSRYSPAVWTPFVRADTSGERLLVERLMDVARRQFPNLVLNLILGEEHQFVDDTDGVTDLTATVSDADLKDIIDDRIREKLDG